MDFQRIKEKNWIPEESEFLTIVDENNQLLEMRTINPVQLGSEVDIRYNLRPDLENVLLISKEHCVNIMLMKISSFKEIDLVPGKRPWVPSEIKYTNDEVIIRQKGLGGGRERIIGTMLSKSSSRYEVHELGQHIDVTIVTPRYNKIVIGIDSTDTKFEGCTMYLAHNIGKKIESIFGSDVRYLKTQASLLCIKVPEKTQNNSSSSLSFAVKKESEEKVIDEVFNLLKKHSISKSAYMTVLRGLKVPEELHRFALRAKKELITINEAKELLNELKLEHREVTGINGIIGATAALGFVNDPSGAAQTAF